jgi:biopolymer transport protein ExbB/TolQ
MPHVIHYEDDIFIADGLVRVLCDASRLDPDPDVVGDAVLATAKLADATLRRIKDLVFQNERLVDRAEYLRLLSKSTRSLADALSDMLRPGSPLAATVASSSDELERIASAQRASASELRDALRESTGDDVSAEDLVSRDELSELLRS